MARTVRNGKKIRTYGDGSGLQMPREMAQTIQMSVR